MQIELKFGKGTKPLEIPDQNWMATLTPNEFNVDLSESEVIKNALQNPIGTSRLGDIVKPGESIVIVTSDITRPMPSYKVLPYVLDELDQAGVNREDVTIVLALGSHRKHTADEQIHLVGEAVYNSGVKVLDSDMTECINLGLCSNGTPVDIFKPVAEADRLICLGNIEYHYFAGYSGGAKAIMPGVSSHEAIQANHKNMVSPESKAASLDTNPVRQDIDQVPDFIKIDFIVNVVLNGKKEIVGTFAGHWKEAHRIGCKFLDEIYGVQLEKQADVVIVSPGGFPKDLNLYQSQKGLDNAKHAVKEGGIIILCASAAEGFGEKTFESWMLEKSPSERVLEIKRNFKLGGHKAAAIGMIQEHTDIYMVTDLAPEIVKKIGFLYFDSLKEAVDAALAKQGAHAEIVVMPMAGSTLPLIK